MASPLYSSQFIVYTPATPNHAYEVPDGFTADIRYASYYETVGAGYADVYIQDSSAAPAVTVISLEALGVNVLYSVSLRVIVPAGGIITLFTGNLGGGPQVYVGGYLLRNEYTS